jgi:hypothetical protein
MVEPDLPRRAAPTPAGRPEGPSARPLLALAGRMARVTAVSPSPLRPPGRRAARSGQPEPGRLARCMAAGPGREEEVETLRPRLTAKDHPWVAGDKCPRGSRWQLLEDTGPVAPAAGRIPAEPPAGGEAVAGDRSAERGCAWHIMGGCREIPRAKWPIVVRSEQPRPDRGVDAERGHQVVDLARTAASPLLTCRVRQHAPPLRHPGSVWVVSLELV